MCGKLDIGLVEWKLAGNSRNTVFVKRNIVNKNKKKTNPNKFIYLFKSNY